MHRAQALIRPVFLTLLLTVSIAARSQAPDTLSPRLHRTGIYFTLGTAVMSFAGNVNLQRMVWENHRYTFSSLWVKAGYGVWAHVFNYTNGGTSASLELMTMTGDGKHHLEFCAGTTFFYDRQDYNNHLSDRENYFYENPDADPAWYPLKEKSEFMNFQPSGSLGYRYQKPGAPPVIRCGIGFPDAVYVSFGLAF